MLGIQVHAVSSKASDVRSVVMELNAKRQAADEEVNVMDPLPDSATEDRHVTQEPVNAAARQDYIEVCILPA